jgi:Flp pilus assembly protein TadG
MRRPSSARGAALVELALALPLLGVVVIGTADFARVFYMAMALENAARAGAQYGAQSSATSGDNAGIQGTVTAAAVNINSVSAFSSRLCSCSNDTGSTFTNGVSCTTGCTGGDHLVISVTVTAASTFSIIAAYPLPGIPRSFSVFRGATLRAQ